MDEFELIEQILLFDMKISNIEFNFLSEINEIIQFLNIDINKKFPRGRPIKYLFENDKKNAKKIYYKKYYDKKHYDKNKLK